MSRKDSKWCAVYVRRSRPYPGEKVSFVALDDEHLDKDLANLKEWGYDVVEVVRRKDVEAALRKWRTVERVMES